MRNCDIGKHEIGWINVKSQRKYFCKMYFFLFYSYKSNACLVDKIRI